MGSEKCHHRRNFLRLAEAAERNLVCELIDDDGRRHIALLCQFVDAVGPEAGHGAPRRHRIDADIEGLEFSAQRFHHGDQSGFVHVGHQLVRIRHARPGGAEDDNASSARFFQQLQRGANDTHRAHDIEFVIGIPRRVIEFPEQRALAAAHGRHQNVQFDRLLLQPQLQGCDISSFGHIGCEPAHRPAHGLLQRHCGLFQFFGIARTDDEFNALFEQRLRALITDAFACSHHESGFTFDTQIHIDPVFNPA